MLRAQTSKYITVLAPKSGQVVCQAQAQKIWKKSEHGKKTTEDTRKLSEDIQKMSDLKRNTPKCDHSPSVKY